MPDQQSTSHSEQKVLLKVEDNGVARLVLNRPQLRNAFDQQVIELLIQQLTHIAADPAIVLVVLEAQGDHFSAGADLNWMARMAENQYSDNKADAQRLAELMHLLYHLPKPTVALIQGAAFGGAVGLAACCDMVFASRDAIFCLSEVKLGLIPAVISPYVVYAIGARAAKRYAISAERFDASTALTLGLVHQLCEDKCQMQQDSLTWITKVISNAPQAMVAAKQLIQQVTNAPLNQTLREKTATLIADIRATDEAREGLSAFLEKRKPIWPAPAAITKKC